MLKLPLTIILRLRQSFIPHPLTPPARQLSKRSHISGLPFFYDAPNESSGAIAKVSYCRVWCESFQSFLSGFPCPDAGSAHTHVLACMNAQRVWSHAPVCPFNGPAVSKIIAIIHTRNLFDLHTTLILRTDLFLSFPDIFGWELSWNLFFLNLSIIIMNEAASCQFISILLVFV